MKYNIEEILNYYKNRIMDRKSIVAQYGINEMYLYKKIKESGMELWDSKQKFNVEEIIDMYKKKKMTRQQIRRKYGISAQYLSNLLHKNKIKLWDKEGAKKKKGGSKYFTWEAYNNNIMSKYNA
jgi:hypothetical protein